MLLVVGEISGDPAARGCRYFGLENRSHLLLYILKSFASTLVRIRILFCEKNPVLPPLIRIYL